MDVVTQPFDRFFVEAGFAWLDTEIVRAPTINGIVRDEIVGNEMPQAPHLSINASLYYVFDLPHSNGTLTPQADWSWRDKYYLGIGNEDSRAPGSDSSVQFGGFGLLNLRLTWENEAQDISTTLYIENVSDKARPTFEFPGTEQFLGSNFTTLTNPRTIGLRVSLKY